MTCDEVTPSLLAWQLGASTSPEREGIEEHLKTCTACFAKFLVIKRVNEDAAAFDERPSPLVRERLRKRVKQARAPRRVTWVMGLAAAAALIILGVAGWRALSNGSLNTPPAAAGHGLVDADGPANLDVL